MLKVKIKDILNSNEKAIKPSNYDFIHYLDTSNITRNFIQDIQKLDTKTDTIPSRARRLVRRNTIIYSLVRPNLEHYGIMRNPLKNMMVSTGFVTLDVKEPTTYDANYVYYNLTQKKYTDYLHTIACNNVSSYPSINPSDIEEMKIEIEPNIEKQKKISNILLRLDQKIELNQKINIELEKIAKALYNYWFMQFDFPDEFGRPYKSSGGKMIYNEVLKREIPEGWTVSSLDDICIMYQPKTLGTDQLLSNGKYCVYGANGIIGKYDQYNHAESEIAVACRGSSCGVVNRTLMKSWITGNAMVVQMKDKTIHNEYLYQMLKCINIKRIVTGSGQPQITRANLAPIQILKPHQGLLLKYSALVASNVTERLRNELENQKLAELRDFLLPMLMNGQVSIKN